jgi:hypothetical protein
MALLIVLSLGAILEAGALPVKPDERRSFIVDTSLPAR